MNRILQGVVHGNSIELAGDLGLAEGQPVTVIVQPVLSPEEALRRSFGGWAADADQLDDFLKGVRKGREQERAEPAP